MKTLYIFLDESGNLDFSRNGTLHYVLAAVCATSPMESSSVLQELKYSQLNDGVDTECFHASEDMQITRDKVISKLASLSNIKVHYIYAKKTKAHPSLHNSSAFYGKLATVLMKFVVGYKSNGYDKVVIIFDKSLTKKDEKSFLGYIKPELKKIGKPYYIYFHRTLSDFNGQIADYFAWSKYISLERNELRPITSLSKISMTELDLFAHGSKEWY